MGKHRHQRGRDVEVGRHSLDAARRFEQRRVDEQRHVVALDPLFRGHFDQPVVAGDDEDRVGPRRIATHCGEVAPQGIVHEQDGGEHVAPRAIEGTALRWNTQGVEALFNALAPQGLFRKLVGRMHRDGLDDIDPRRAGRRPCSAPCKLQQPAVIVAPLVCLLRTRADAAAVQHLADANSFQVTVLAVEARLGATDEPCVVAMLPSQPNRLWWAGSGSGNSR